MSFRTAAAWKFRQSFFEEVTFQLRQATVCLWLCNCLHIPVLTLGHINVPELGSLRVIGGQYAPGRAVGIRDSTGKAPLSVPGKQSPKYMYACCNYISMRKTEEKFGQHLKINEQRGDLLKAPNSRSSP